MSNKPLVIDRSCENLLIFIDNHVSKIVPLYRGTDVSREKQPAPGCKDWRNRNDIYERNIEWLANNPFGFNWNERTIAVDVDTTDSMEFFEWYIKQHNLNCWVLKTTKGKQYIFSTNKTTFLNNSAKYLNACLMCFDIRDSAGQSAINLCCSGMRTLTLLDPSRPITNLEDIEIFKKEFVFSRSKKTIYGAFEIGEFFAIGDGNTHDYLLRFKRLLLSNEFEPEIIKKAGNLIRSYLLSFDNFGWLKNYFNWDTQLNAVSDEAEKPKVKSIVRQYQKKSKELENEVESNIYKVINNDFKIEKIYRETGGNTMFYLNENGALKIMPKSAIVNYYLDSGIFENSLLEHKLANVISQSLDSARSAVIDYNADFMTRNIMFQNGYLNLENYKWNDGICKDLAKVYFDYAIDLSKETPLFDALFEALSKKWDEMVAAAFFMNMLDCHSRDRFGVILEGKNNTGKSQFIELITKIFSPFTAARNLATICSQNSDLSIGTNLIVYGNEVASNFILNGESLKSMITRDTQQVRSLYCNPTHVKSIATILFATNSTINVKKVESVDGLTRRIFYYVWDSYLFDEAPAWFNKNYVFSHEEMSDFFQGIIKLFLNSKYNFGGKYQKVINNYPKNIFCKMIVAQDSCYDFFKNVLNDINLNGINRVDFDLGSYYKYSTEKVENGTKKTFILSKKELYNWYVFYCKNNGMLPKQSTYFCNFIADVLVREEKLAIEKRLVWFKFEKQVYSQELSKMIKESDNIKKESYIFEWTAKNDENLI